MTSSAYGSGNERYLMVSLFLFLFFNQALLGARGKIDLSSIYKE